MPFAPHDLAFISDPYPTYEELRELTRFPRIELAEPPESKPNYVIRGLRGLRVHV